MPVRESQKKAYKRYVEKNKEKIAAYKAKYWQENKHRWSKPKGSIDPTPSELTEAQLSEAKVN